MQTIPFPDPGRPDTRSTTRFMLWVGRQQWRTQVLGMLAGMAWMLAIALVPAAVGKGVDDGIVPGDLGGLVRWALVLIGLGAICAVTAAIRHYFAVYNWLFASYRGAQLTAQGAERAGPALTRTMPSGEVVAVFANDVMRLGGLYDVMGRFSGAVVSYAVVGAILLAASPALGWLVLLGGPVMLASLSLIVRPLQRRQARQREEAGRLTTLGADTVAGLRVLRGIGGEQTFLRRYEQQSARVRERGFQVAGIQAALDSAEVLIPGIFVVLVTWLGAREAVTGDITAGQLVAFYGYTAFLTMPLQTAIEVVDRGIRAQIAAGKMLRVMAVQPDHDAARPSTVPVPPADADLVDPLSGTVIRGGLLTAIVSARPEESSAVADRLGRHGPGPHQTTWGGVRLDDLSIADVRRHVVVSEPDPRLFTGVLREQLSGHANGRPSADGTGGGHADREVLAALTTASALDVLDAVADGLDGTVEERGRSYSGGQRQRLALSRALLTEAPVLVLVEPTSAVDAHTEARIAGRLAEHRRGRTTVVTTVSPLLLGQADEVVVLEDGLVTLTGTHRELLDHPAYRHIVIRGEEDDQ
ncbi:MULTISPECIES: ABC transporter ATP-binding protein [unclassified Phycicoccus]|uniref:ABC transporter ATP-binding protein n=1 Tax=unclassified Phycicoccus TaxID=2637926 RepID=UPI0007036662|nr:MULTISPECIES: ABC transporter ATP-binding protein [unclassified Phycicoccus]KRF26641.1 multidrug ABC transporter permease [Phycicoccus sp. Soil803]KRF27373.1 multidrug ABC transporter permease [Phycicoccus sp. Soil802]